MKALRQAVIAVHLEAEGRTASYLKQRKLNISCRKGCFSCCFALVMVGLGEAEYLREHLEPQVLSQVEQVGQQRLKRMAKEKNKPDFATRFFLEAHRCPLLSEDGACSAHAARPLACRGVLTDLEAHYCAPGVVPRLKGAEKLEYQRQLKPHHGPEHYLKTPWQASERLANKLWQTEQKVRGFTVVGELASMVYLLGQKDFGEGLEAGKDLVWSYLEEKKLLGGDWGFWVG